MNFVFALAHLILVHGVDGREINVNVEEVTAIHCKIPGKENALFAEGVNAVINLTDGSRVSVKETCGEIRELMKEDKQ